MSSESAEHTLWIEDHGPVALLRVHRPHRQNALDRATMRAFAQTVARLHARCAEGEGAPRALVLAGSAGRFLAGGDLKDLHTVRSAEDAEAFSAVMRDATAQLSALPIPVIAAIDRFALGGGLEIALAADLRVATPEAQLSFRQITFALTTAWGAVPRLRALVGRSTALRLLLDAPMLSGVEAFELGLVDRLAPAAKGAEAEALAWAHRLAQADPFATRSLKRLVAQSDPEAAQIQRADALEAELFGLSWQADAHHEAVARYWQRAQRRAAQSAPEEAAQSVHSAPEEVPQSVHSAPEEATAQRAGQGAPAPRSARGSAPVPPQITAPSGDRRGLFIVLEGLDGAGTSTQQRRLGAWLEQRGFAVHLTAQPSGGPVGQMLRQALAGTLLGAGGPKLCPRAIAALFAADRADHWAREIEPALAAGQIVLCDRYVHSSLAYQGLDTQDPQWVLTLNAPFTSPDLLLYLEVSPAVASERRGQRGQAREIYEENAFLEKVAGAYLAAFERRDRERVVRIDADLDLDRVETALRAAIEPSLHPAER